jgi:hypothetical protein
MSSFNRWSSSTRQSPSKLIFATDVFSSDWDGVPAADENKRLYHFHGYIAH